MSEVVYKHSAGGVVIHNDTVLTISSASRNSVGFPKGTIDEGESPEQAAVREVKEETGYDIVILEKLDDYTFEFDWTDGKHHIKTVSYFLMRLANDAPPTPNLQPGEDFEVQWLSADETMNELTYNDSKEALKLGLEKYATHSH